MKYAELKKQVAKATAEAAEAKRALEDVRAITVSVVGNAPKQALVEFRLRQRTDAVTYEMYAGRDGFKASMESDAIRKIARELLMSGLLNVRSENYFSNEQTTEFSLWVAKI